MTVTRQKRSRDKNDITTMQLRKGNKLRLKNILDLHGFESLDEALDEILSFYEDAHTHLSDLSVNDHD